MICSDTDAQRFLINLSFNTGVLLLRSRSKLYQIGPVLIFTNYSLAKNSKPLEVISIAINQFIQSLIRGTCGYWTLWKLQMEDTQQNDFPHREPLHHHFGYCQSNYYHLSPFPCCSRKQNFLVSLLSAPLLSAAARSSSVDVSLMQPQAQLLYKYITRSKDR